MVKTKQEQFMAVLNVRLAGRGCPMCGQTNRTVIDQYVGAMISPSGTQFNIGPVIPCAGLLCNNCGFISAHAHHVLNVTPE